MTARAPKIQRVALGFGSNIAPAEHLPRALRLLAERVPVVALSQVWQGPAVGAAGPDFYNAVAVVNLPFSAEHFKRTVLRPLESALGRVRTGDLNAPRSIDLDILVVGSRARDPEIWLRAYWAVPLAELMPGLRHPESGEPLVAIARRLQKGSRLRVVRLEGWRLDTSPV